MEDSITVVECKNACPSDSLQRFLEDFSCIIIIKQRVCPLELQENKISKDSMTNLFQQNGYFYLWDAIGITFNKYIQINYPDVTEGKREQ